MLCGVFLLSARADKTQFEKHSVEGRKKELNNNSSQAGIQCVDTFVILELPFNIFELICVCSSFVAANMVAQFGSRTENRAKETSRGNVVNLLDSEDGSEAPG